MHVPSRSFRLGLKTKHSGAGPRVAMCLGAGGTTLPTVTTGSTKMEFRSFWRRRPGFNFQGSRDFAEFTLLGQAPSEEDHVDHAEEEEEVGFSELRGF